MVRGPNKNEIIKELHDHAAHSEALNISVVLITAALFFISTGIMIVLTTTSTMSTITSSQSISQLKTIENWGYVWIAIGVALFVGGMFSILCLEKVKDKIKEKYGWAHL